MIEIIKEDISVKLIYSDPWKDILKEGWINSRPQSSGEEINFFEVLKIDTPVSELAGFVAEFRVPILFREIICTPRDHIIWARTSRVDNLIKSWSICSKITDSSLKAIESLANKLLLEAKTDSQDEFRNNLPLSYMTSFTSRMSIRSSIKMLKYFIQLRQKYPFIADAAHQLIIQLMEILQTIEIPISELLKIIKVDDICQMTKYENNDFQKIGDYSVIEGDYSVMLRSQIIRHRVLHVVDDLSKYFNSREVWSTPISDKMHLSIGATNEIWKSIIGKRMCWLAHSSIWSDIIEKISNNNIRIIEDLIPCKDGKCPYNEDCRQRIIKNDPGLPCPRNLSLNEDSIKTELNNWNKDALIKDMENYVIKSKRPKDYWINQINNFMEKTQ